MNGMFYGLYAAGYAHRRASEAESAARKSQAKATEVFRELRVLEERLDKLILVNTALWSLVQERTGLTEDDLVQRVQQIDLQDGVADGKITRMLQKCGRCGRTVSRRHRKCLFCGSEDLSEGPFVGV